MRAEMICSGDELLSGAVSDTNTADLAGVLAAVGVQFVRSTVVGDGLYEIVDAVREAAGRADLVIITGGLGPTEDDRTALAVARAAGVELVQDDQALERLKARLSHFKAPLTDNNRRQALVPKGARVLQSDVGTAPGFTLRLGSAQIFVLPGVPREALWFCQQYILPELVERQPGALASVTLRCLGITESRLDQEVQGLAEAHPGISVHFRTRMPENQLRIVARAADPDAAQQLLLRAREDAVQRLQQWIFSADGRSLGAVLRDDLVARGQTVAVAESCTGGWIQKLLTDEPGSSRVVLGGVVAYANDVKVRLLGVQEETLARVGAVSAEVAEQMAAGVRERLGADWGLATTGIAGPEGGSAEKPVGLVYVALASRAGVVHKRWQLPGNRERVRLSASMALLRWLHQELVGGGTPG